MTSVMLGVKPASINMHDIRVILSWPQKIPGISQNDTRMNGACFRSDCLLIASNAQI